METASKKQRVAAGDTDMVDIVGKECEEEKKEEEQGTKQDEAKTMVDVDVVGSSKKMETVHNDNMRTKEHPTYGKYLEKMQRAISKYRTIHKLVSGGSSWDVPDNDESRELASLIMKIQGPFCIKELVKTRSGFRPVRQEIIINIDGEPVGTLFNLDVDKIISKATVAPFGRGSETIIDPSVRNALEITADRLSTTIEVKGSNSRKKKSGKDFVFNPLRFFCNSDRLAPRNLILKAKLQKMHIHPEGGKFEPHVDTSHGEGHHATLVAILPTEYEGGELVVEHGGKEVVIGGKEEEEEVENKEQEGGDDEEEEEEKEKAIKMGCFYTDCTHRVLPVTSGTRIALQYDLFLTNKSYDFPLSERAFASLDNERHPERGDMASRLADDPAFVDSFIAAVDKLMKKHPRMNLAILLRHRYPAHSLATSMLRGGDQGLYDVLKRVCSSRMTDEPIVAPIVVGYGDDHNSDGMMTSRAAPFDPDVLGESVSSTKVAKISKEEAICVFGSLGDDLDELYSREYTGDDDVPYNSSYLSTALVIRCI